MMETKTDAELAQEIVRRLEERLEASSLALWTARNLRNFLKEEEQGEGA